MKISVVIPSYQRPDWALRCANSCLLQNFSHGQFEVIIALSEQNRAKMGNLKSMLSPRIRVLYSESTHVNVLRNFGALNAYGEIIYFLDDDCYLQNQNQLEKLYKIHKEFPYAVGIGGGYLSDPGATIVARFYNQFVNLWLNAYTAEVGHTLFLPGGNASYKSFIFAKGIAAFDEGLPFGGEESELNLRLKKAGYTVIQSSHLDVFHLSRPGWLALFKKAWVQGRGKVHQDNAIAKKYRNMRKPLLELSKLGPTYIMLTAIYYAIVCIAHWKMIIFTRSPISASLNSSSLSQRMKNLIVPENP